MSATNTLTPDPLTPTTLTPSAKLYDTSQKIGFSCLLIAQAFFVSYLIAGYGFTGLSEGVSQWNRFNSTAYVAGDYLGNAMYAAHVLLAIVMIMGGSLQLMPAIRRKYRSFHKYNGRLFVTLACSISLAGMYLLLSRGTVSTPLLHGLTAFSGIMVILSSFFAIRAIRNANVALHQRWALHLFLAANGVLFFRLFIFAWMTLFGTLGINTADFTGPAVIGVSVLSYVTPHIIAQLIWMANHENHVLLKICISVTLLLVSAAFLIGLFSLTFGIWYPTITG
ncbi:DUF2306 domain-containing protein [Alteromonas sp. 1_MG-2023]|uniref:DUF2306 domain-containing protein n=1 Tax=Alteromonas sp. 1_MG-2023 TaxID=3062669 RepID=UPI0026E412D9|nr:DUF2306 domain-containing protein [Alteromonas sp. 1_MG-2023]MDO6565609.1 DUF2306 domain-containing protein [Alteromonas sp. 1_MG-2023]